jgi:hypothetical protein
LDSSSPRFRLFACSSPGVNAAPGCSQL